MQIWTCKIVDIPRNCKMEMVATCSTTDSNGSCHGLAPSFFEEMTPCWQKHRRRWPGNPNGRSKFRKYRVYLPILRLLTSMRSWLLLRGWRQQLLPLTHAIVFRRDDTLPTSKTSLVMTRIDQNSAFTKIYAYEIKQDLSKNISFAARMLRLWCHCTMFFPTITCKAFVLTYEK